MPKRLYAFWKYDSIPFVLGGEVLKIREEDGSVFVKGYDRYMSSYFRRESIIAIMPYDKGVKLHKKLKKEEARYRRIEKKAYLRLKNMKSIIQKANTYGELQETPNS